MVTDWRAKAGASSPRRHNYKSLIEIKPAEVRRWIRYVIFSSPKMKRLKQITRMQKHSTLTLTVFALATVASAAHAQVTIDASKITCEQFANSKVASVRSVALWLSGYYSGKRGSSLDANVLEANSAKLENLCRQSDNLKLPVMTAVEQIWSKK